MSATSYRFRVGEIECIQVADGDNRYTADDLFSSVPQETAAEAVRQRGLRPEELVVPYTSLVIKTPGHCVLVDTGIGAGVVPTAGALLANLRAEEIEPPDIDTVILTHGHPDHIGGTVGQDGQPAFPNARYVMWKGEWDFWIAAATTGSVPAVPEFMATLARNTLPPIQGQLELAEREGEVVPGVHLVLASGHTPGHVALLISSGNALALHLTDAVLHPIALEHPDWWSAFDLDPAQAVATRRRLLDRAVGERAVVSTAHCPFPGVAHVIPHGEGWQWQAVDPTQGERDRTAVPAVGAPPRRAPAKRRWWPWGR